jgi:TPP-dependent pyruvate/acetoin dehydrogenase alpha subunit
MYRMMFLIRRVEESLLELAESGKIGGAMHTAIGHEGAPWAWPPRCTRTTI